MTTKTPDELREQRAQLIASTGLTEAVLRERAEAFQLYPEHMDVWRTVEGIDYLLASPDVPAEEQASEHGPVVQVGWYCWRCHGLNSEACRSDCVPVYVPADWEELMLPEVQRHQDGEYSPEDRMAEVRKLHERINAEDADGGYCDLCSNHGDIHWPCATIKALDGENR
ncbi:hypothetical protein [Streptomyces sp. NEAU-H3]|uniref:hypothetical protein n=1 Tax=Streptomyces sp. NEAU-H3 TaxID=2720636 RepID=UPI001439355D|nr:hypothetical protein [Streptomyces sp. NEAU-H3]NJA56689.1 hypothetical protein [Streptomyces sp. NEAU-H3]